MRNEMIYYVYNSIELNIQRMTNYKNISLDNIRGKKRIKKKEKRINTLEMCVGSLDHLDNCKSFGVFNIFKSMFENGYIFFIC